MHPVVVDDPHGAEAQVGGVVVIAEGEGVVGVEPAVVEVASLASLANPNHAYLLSYTCTLLATQVYGQKTPSVIRPGQRLPDLLQQPDEFLQLALGEMAHELMVQ